MKRYLAILGTATLLALPTVVSAETNSGANHEQVPVQRTSDAGRLAEVLGRKGVITEQELREVSAPAAPAKTKADQETNFYLENGILW